MNPYIEQKILNADPLELIRILYQHGIGFIGEAREHLRNHRTAERARSIRLACGVVVELSRALRSEAAPEIAIRLKNLYSYIQGRLIEADINEKEEPLAEALALMTTLSEAWQFDSAPQPRPAQSIAWQAAMATDGARSRFELQG